MITTLARKSKIKSLSKLRNKYISKQANFSLFFVKNPLQIRLFLFLISIFDQWPELLLGWNLKPEIKILKVIHHAYTYINSFNSFNSNGNSKDYKNLFMIFARVIGIYVELLESSESAKKNSYIHTRIIFYKQRL